MARKIVITSGKGGVGKTTIAANLAVRLSIKGERVILCDADFGLNNIDLMVNVENCISYDIVDVIEGRCRAKQALIRHPRFPNLYILSCSHAAPERYISPQALKIVLEGLSPQFDFIIIDCPAGIDEGFHRAVATANEALVVATPHLSSIRDADKVITILKSYALINISLVVNKVRGDFLVDEKIITPKEISEILKIPLIGVLPEVDEIFLNDLDDHSRAYRLLANNILLNKIKIYNPAREYTGFLGGLKKIIKGL